LRVMGERGTERRGITRTRNDRPVLLPALEGWPPGIEREPRIARQGRRGGRRPYLVLVVKRTELGQLVLRGRGAPCLGGASDAGGGLLRADRKGAAKGGREGRNAGSKGRAEYERVRSDRRHRGCGRLRAKRNPDRVHSPVVVGSLVRECAVRLRRSGVYGPEWRRNGVGIDSRGEFVALVCAPLGLCR